MNAIGTRVIIRKQDADKQTSSGIILRSPTDVPKIYVVKIGPKVTIEIKEGDEIIVDWNKLSRFEFLEQEYFVVDESAILAVFDA